MIWSDALGAFLMLSGTIFSVLAAWGVVNFPSPIARMHAATKSASLGLALLALGSGIAAQSWGAVGIAVLVTIFLFATSPISGHLLGRAAYLSGDSGQLVSDDFAESVVPMAAAQAQPAGRFSIVRWSGLVVVWMLLWRDVSFGTFIGGACVGGLIEGLQRRYRPARTWRPWGLVKFLIRYTGMVIASNVRVAWEVVTPSNVNIREAVVRVPLQSQSLPVAILLANAVSYSPGSLTIELETEPNVLFVHVLHFTSTEDVQAQVHDLERLVAAAID